jgi:hypothetical protein
MKRKNGDVKIAAWKSSGLSFYLISCECVFMCVHMVGGVSGHYLTLFTAQACSWQKEICIATFPFSKSNFNTANTFLHG